MITPVLAPATVPPGIRVYAIGDVHGCLDQLDALHDAIKDDMTRRNLPKMGDSGTILVHLGDYIDRGPDSSGVIERLLAPFAVPPGVATPHVVNLMGNHEAMLLDALDGQRSSAEMWLANGGVASLQSWAVPPRTPPRKWAALIPPAHQAFLRGLALLHQVGGYVFVHAGLRPGTPIAEQTRHDMLWIREPFLSSEQALGAVVVHGHTPEEPYPVVRTNRIGLDTGAVLGGVLSCVVLEGDTMAFLQA
ncbi:MAG: hypothetical protein ABS99_06860 [Acetobacteraceae bacterium SCN 69-10]|nr:serine/threonine protein phosphatase [Rhodospirillales bacterium]ODU55798.1 MAG: hypothetical protein ABS99_06860 [Acetobacteraceae bacterium SCN 69-10]OJY65704.1 MAG: hypothetical protein BGP12_17795 [Rhodospirillales bacterium 70-18]